MKRTQRAFTALFCAASFMVLGVAHAQVGDSIGAPNYGLEVPAVEDDPASAVRGSLGVSLENLSLKNNPGRLVFLLNGGFALLFGAVAFFQSPVVIASRSAIMTNSAIGGPVIL